MISDRLIQKKDSLALVGLGYVGLPIAVAFAKRGIKVIGFDLNQRKIDALKDGVDETGEVSSEELKHVAPYLQLTSDSSLLKESKFIIVAVPTPVDENRTPDLSPLESASELIGKSISHGAYVVYESTVYPGVTEDFCVPIIEKYSSLSWSRGDFFVGYSPERINPGDKEHTLSKIVKIVSGQNPQVCKEIAAVYKIVIDAGVHEAESIKVAEAAKVIENTQRDLNIALMNELSIIFNKIGINTEAVLKAAGTKWNFLKFYPGLVGGHCIGVDPYYLTSKAEQLGYHPQVVLAGRRINDSMGAYVAEQTVKQMIKAGHPVLNSKVLVMGLTFKEDVPDFRNSKVFDIIKELKSYQINVLAHDPFTTASTMQGVELVDLEKIEGVDAVILATPHKEYKTFSLEKIKSFFKKDKQPILADVRWVFSAKQAQEAGFVYWSL